MKRVIGIVFGLALVLVGLTTPAQAAPQYVVNMQFVHNYDGLDGRRILYEEANPSGGYLRYWSAENTTTYSDPNTYRVIAVYIGRGWSVLIEDNNGNVLTNYACGGTVPGNPGNAKRILVPGAYASSPNVIQQRQLWVYKDPYCP